MTSDIEDLGLFEFEPDIDASTGQIVATVAYARSAYQSDLDPLLFPSLDSFEVSFSPTGGSFAGVASAESIADSCKFDATSSSSTPPSRAVRVPPLLSLPLNFSTLPLPPHELRGLSSRRRLDSGQRPPHQQLSTTMANPSYPPPDAAAARVKPERESPPRDHHRRGYQACQPCRQRKVKCDLGSVDNPAEPPCLRCRREQKQCVFSDTRRKRKLSDGEGGSSDGTLKRRLTTSAPPEDSIPELSAKSQYSVSPSFPTTTLAPQQWDANLPQASFISQPFQQSQDSRTFHMYSQSMPVESKQTMLNKAAADVLETPISTSYDALYLLSQAAGQTKEASQPKSQNIASHLRSPSTAFASPGSTNPSHHRTVSNNMTPSNLIDPAMMLDTEQVNHSIDESGNHNALRIWSRMRFVRAGWFTAHEAMEYLEYYYQHIAPLTPIIPPDFRAPSKHMALLTEEPILAISLLAISSRHMKLSGPGAESRAYSIHDKLWNYLRCMVERLLWGQEQFGGGFCGGGAVQLRESKSGQVTWKGSLRTLGTIEAILLLTDWHPRALHFPPGDDENRLLDADYNLFKDSPGPKSEESGDGTDGHVKVPYAKWLEPAWRSDRMSWMLLGLAQALSFELGVFDNNHYTCQDQHGASSDCARKRRVRRLVLVYVSQTSGRLGIPSMLPFDHWETDPVFERTYHAQTRGRPEDPVDLMQERWLHIAGIMYQANQRIFPSREFTRDLISSGQYVASIAEFNPLLKSWKEKFDRISSQLTPVMASLLTMEYQYARLYINSLALQKVVESWVKISKENTATTEHDRNAKAGVGVAAAGSGAVSFSMLFDIFKPNKEYIEEVADAAGTLLHCVVDGLGPGDSLRHAPVRTYFRVLSGLMFTLKRFSFGASEQDVRQSLEILDKTTDLLGGCVVDDIHLSFQTANLVRTIATALRKTFIRIQAPTGESREHSRHQTPYAQDHGQANETPQHGQQHVHLNYGMPATTEDTLAGIQALPMTNYQNITYMPPPNYTMYLPDVDTDTDPNEQYGMSSSQNLPNGGNASSYGNTDWFALPLDNIFNSSMGTVDQGFGGIGPTVGDRDMLELITNENLDRWPDAFSNGFH